jgi:hypothetical protein
MKILYLLLKFEKEFIDYEMKNINTQRNKKLITTAIPM